MKDFLWRHKSLVIIWFIVLLIGGYIAFTLLAVSSNGDENPYTKNSVQPQPSSQTESVTNQPKKAKVGQATKDGDLEFTVTGITCEGETNIGTPYAEAEAEGTFCRLHLRLKNLGNQNISLPLSAQKALASYDTPMPANIPATQYAQTDHTKGYWYDQIAPGSTVSGDLLFDVNGNEKLFQVQLHATETSPGIFVDSPK